MSDEEVLGKFKAVEQYTEEYQFLGMRWLVSSDHVMSIRQYDFDMNNFIEIMMNGFIEKYKKRVKGGGFVIPESEKKASTLFQSMLKENKLVIYTKTMLPTNLRKDPAHIYTLYPELAFGYSDRVLLDASRVFDGKCNFYFPDAPLPGYILSHNKKYILIFASMMADSLEGEDYGLLKKDNQKSFSDDDDLW